MAENIRRGMQNINLGADDPPVLLPANVVNEAAEGNRFILIGRPVMPRRQNIRSIIATLPRNWGHVGVHGRMLEGRQFQFVFPSEEALEMVLRRGPWAFADRMLILERWTPNFNPLMLNFIPFWIQIRGIPVQFMSQDIVMHIGRALGMYMEVDYSPDVAARRDYARVRVNWNVDEPLRFQRNFQFTEGVNTLLRLTFERLRGFCEVCGRLTHDSGACLLQNGGPANEDDDDVSVGDDNETQDPANHGVIIEEIVDGGVNGGAGEEPVENEEAAVEPMDAPRAITDNDDAEDEMWTNQAMHTMYSGELNTEAMFNPINPSGARRDGKELMKRKTWLEQTEGNKLMLLQLERGETSGTSSGKRQKSEARTNEEIVRILYILWWRTVTSSNHRSFTKLIHDDVELGIHGVAHREEELTRFDREFWRRR
ncbi:hypothetical protein Bca101_048877 [Brassica carinata]